MKIEKLNLDKTQKVEDPLLLIKELEETRKNVFEIFNKLLEGNDYETFLEKINQYVDSLDEKSLKELAKDIKENLIENNDCFQSFKEFNIDILAEDLTRKEYSHPIIFKNRIQFGPDKEPLIEDEGVSGYYNPKTDQIIIYVTEKENRELLKNFLVNPEDPKDLNYRVKLFLKYGNISPLTLTIQHELIHAEQKGGLSPFSKELEEIQAFRQLLFQNSRMLNLGFNIFRQVKQMFEKDQSPLEFLQKKGGKIQEILDSFYSLSEKQKNEIFEIFGLSPEIIKSDLEKIMNFDFSPELEERPYDFNKERIINSVIILEQLRTLGFSEKEIAHLIRDKGNNWDLKTCRYVELEDFIEKELKKRGIKKEDLDQMVDNHILKMKINQNKFQIRRLNFLKEKIFK